MSPKKDEPIRVIIPESNLHAMSRKDRQELLSRLVRRDKKLAALLSTSKRTSSES